MKWTIALLFAAVAAAFCVTAAAQGRYEEDVTEYRFDDEAVLGDLIGPGGGGIVVRQPGKQKSLIRIRKHFVPEVLKSVEHI
jgi:hypothetical protein